jgi:UDP-glucose 4-epimerase
MKKATVLITGGAGFIGSHLADLFAHNGHDVHIIDDLSGGSTDNLDPKYHFYQADLRDTAKTAELIAGIKPELVYHLAANAAENKAQYSPIDISTRNYDTFMNVLVAALNNGMKRMVVTSSIAVYGSGQTPFLETDTPEPEDIYGISKLAMEHSLRILAEAHGFEYVITRPHNVYGPRQNMRDPYRNVVTIFMNSLLKGEPYTIYGDGEQKRCFSYVSDVVDGLYACAQPEVRNMTFNIGSDRSYTINQLSDLIQTVSRSSIAPNHLPARHLDVTEAVSDHSLARKLLDYKDRISLEEGLLATWKYAKDQGYQEPVYGGIEIESSHMPQNWKP